MKHILVSEGFDAKLFCIPITVAERHKKYNKAERSRKTKASPLSQMDSPLLALAAFQRSAKKKENICLIFCFFPLKVND